MTGRLVRRLGDSLAWLASIGQQGSLSNARAASVECSRRRLERAEVDALLAGRAQESAAALLTPVVRAAR